MNSCFLIVLMGATVIGWLVAEVFLILIFRYLLPIKQGDLRQLLLNKAVELAGPEKDCLVDKVRAFNLEAEVVPVLDVRLEDLIEQLRGQIPMGGMLLSGAWIERFKSKIKQEILKSLPAIKENLAKKVGQEFDFQKMIEEKVQALDFTELGRSFRQIYRFDLLKLRGAGALIGFGIGLLELVLFTLFCN